MPIMVSRGATFTPCPAGSHAATCCDVVDLGIVKTNFNNQPKSQHKVAVVWQTGESRDDGKPFLVKKRYTMSLHEKASLRKDLESWRGRSFTDDELNGFDLEVLIGVPCMISVVHAAQNGSVFANVSAIMKLPKGLPPVGIDPSYVRVQDRPSDDPETAAGAPEDWSATNDDVPF